MPRLDLLLVTQGLARSRTRAQRLIRHGRVCLADSDRVLTKPGEKLPDDTRLSVADDPEERYVSRAGLKLEALLQALALDLEGQLVLDVGQSTGGFTDCALAHGARHVIGVEVGHDQLDPSLRDDPRVTCLEGLNARAMAEDARLAETLAAQGGGAPDLAVMDVSFISQTLILTELATLLTTGGRLVSLVKPQFEVGPGGVDSQGLVRDTARYAEVEARIRQCCREANLVIQHWQESPIRGGDGNREFLLYALRG
ncbi:MULTISPECIES: TlyA family RNA methyltransferase [unclassified Halomonas]|uniref:TlyA family RNA methyltransferase n=1 Tax=unclassified Halomonas TaxID=2609666 RepID=UPI002883E31A|nr:MULTISPECIES: TlyA family RNA methyltransferase [unclassified Halomonas]MDT0502374.1 TlyA family RNA methyltransferase [Halomonas sp. PAR7]MDT0510907.1 TlyA family RNA methyltransferase [Halomonas sp. LES1]MDT0592769.1 TlyA family RNA methyltransferase [Halomonas sp. PAR8]